MVERATLIFAASGLAAALLMAASQPSVLAQAQPGLWEISGAPGTSAPIRQCVADIASLARFEHRSKACSAKVLKDADSSIMVEYTCGGSGFGNSEIHMITP